MLEKGHISPENNQPSLAKWYLWIKVMFAAWALEYPDYLQSKIEVKQQITNKEYWQDSEQLRSFEDLLQIIDAVLRYPEFLLNSRYVVIQTILGYDPYKAKEQVYMNEKIQEIKKSFVDSPRKTMVTTGLYNPWDVFDNQI